MKNINYLNKNKSKNYIGFNIEKNKTKIYQLLKKTNNQTRQINCLFAASRYNFHY